MDRERGFDVRAWGRGGGVFSHLLHTYFRFTVVHVNGIVLIKCKILAELLFVCYLNWSQFNKTLLV